MEKDQDFGVLLGLAYGAFVEELRATLAEQGYDGLSRSFGYVARALALGPINLRELADHLGITSQGALKIVDELESGGYVERVADPADGRAKQLRLTRRGRAALDAARAIHRRFEQRLAADLGERRVASMRAVLTEIVDRRARSGIPTKLRPV
jgi:DNA-binding MarR family transcriptional regulator